MRRRDSAGCSRKGCEQKWTALLQCDKQVNEVCALQSLQLLQQAQALTMLLTACLGNVFVWLLEYLPQHQATFEARLEVRHQLCVPHISPNSSLV